jgi:dTDP-4-amino-4,6-dideoxygalactose transaminase
MIPFTAFAREPAELRAAMRDAFDAVVASGYWVLGPAVSAFEEQWAERCGVPYAVGTANGLDALEIALRALGIGTGDEVITTPMTALATVLAISRAGAIPVLADIDPASALLDVASAERCVTPRTRAITPVHLYGNGSAAPEWAAFADRHGLSLIEDCAQAHLATVGGQPVGSFGASGVFSFYPTKNLGAIGDAGALVTDDAALAERARMLRNYGQKDRYHHEVAGMNSRLDELQAALLIVRLRWLQEQTERRRDVAAAYADGITNSRVTLLTPPAEPAAHVHHLFVVRCTERDILRDHLEARGVQTLIHYPIPAHLQTPYRSIARDPVGLANSEQHAQTCLSLPCHSGLTDEEVATVIDVVNGFGKR